MRAWIAVAGLLALFGAACGDDGKCAPNTVQLTVALDRVGAADTLAFDLVFDGMAKQQSLPNIGGRARGVVELQFSTGYAAGKAVDVVVRALKDGVVIGEATKTIALVAGCTNASITIESATGGDLGPPDLTSAMPDLVGVPVIACTTPSECASGFCVDGFCCDRACDGQCEACGEPSALGACVTVTSGAPRGARTACTGTGTSCGGTCGGDPNACAYPTTECAPGSCTAGVATNPALCTNGACPAQTTTTCADTTDTKYCGQRGCAGVAVIAAAYDATCVALTDGDAYCWGANGAGQLGTGDLDPRPTPTRIPSLSRVSQLSADALGFPAVCARRDDGTAFCWGNNLRGRLGNGATPTDFTPSATPTPVLASAGVPFAGISAIAIGHTHACLLDADGAPWCWGHQLYGQLGDGVTTDTSVGYPVKANGGITGASGLTAGSYQTFLTTSATTPTDVAGWGYNGGLVLTAPSNGQKVSEPYAVSAVDNLVNGSLPKPLGTGGLYGTACAVTSSGTLLCWGANTGGLLGRNADPAMLAFSGTPSEVCADASACDGSNAGLHALKNVKVVGFGDKHGCALAGTGVRCWGTDDNFGVLGDGVMTTHAVWSATVGPSFAQPVIDLAVGGYHACAVLADRTLQCWGWGGALGTGGVHQYTPMAVAFE